MEKSSYNLRIIKVQIDLSDYYKEKWEYPIEQSHFPNTHDFFSANTPPETHRDPPKHLEFLPTRGFSESHRCGHVVLFLIGCVKAATFLFNSLTIRN